MTAPPTTSTRTRRRARSPPRCPPTRRSSSPTSTAGCGIPRTPSSRISTATADEVRCRPRRVSMEGCGRSSPPASRRSRAGSRRHTSSTAARPHTLLLELFTDAGIGTKITGMKLRGAARSSRPAGSCRPTRAPDRVRPRRGRAALGLRRQGVPRLPGGDLGLLGRSLPPGRGRGGARAGRHAHARLEPLPDRGRGAARPAARGIEPGRQGVSLQLGDRGERVRDQAGPKARARPRDRGARDRRSRGRVPRSHDGLALGDPGLATNDSFSPYLPGFRAVPRDDPEAWRPRSASARRP